jgi:hypothetical protein
MSGIYLFILLFSPRWGRYILIWLRGKFRWEYNYSNNNIKAFKNNVIRLDSPQKV